MPGDELMEYICNENDPDQGHYVGPARLPTDGFDIRPPAAKPWSWFRYTRLQSRFVCARKNATEVACSVPSMGRI